MVYDNVMLERCDKGVINNMCDYFPVLGVHTKAHLKSQLIFNNHASVNMQKMIWCAIDFDFVNSNAW